MSELIALSDCLSPYDVFANLKVETANEVIGLMADHRHKGGTVKASYRDAVERREQSMPTGLPLEDGLAVAMPHTDPEHVRKSSFAVASLSSPVTFRSMDDPDKELSVRLIFMLALRSKEEQLETLVTIGQLLQSQQTLLHMLEAETGEEIARRLQHFLS